MPYRYPDPSPVAFKPGSLWHAEEEQPRIKPLYHLFVAACLKGSGLEFLDQVMRLIWDGRQDDWTEKSVMDNALAAAGLDRAELEGIDAAVISDTLNANHDAMLAANHHGVPLMVYRDEPFYGQDRFDHLILRMREVGDV